MSLVREILFGVLSQVYLWTDVVSVIALQPYKVQKCNLSDGGQHCGRVRWWWESGVGMSPETWCYLFLFPFLKIYSFVRSQYTVRSVVNTRDLPVFFYMSLNTPPAYGRYFNVSWNRQLLTSDYIELLLFITPDISHLQLSGGNTFVFSLTLAS